MLFFLMIVIVGSLLTYVVLDGYDLGIGVLTLFQRMPPAAARCSRSSGTSGTGTKRG
jgi:cytochrome bd-type quinol oxidase subunit 2